MHILSAIQPDLHIALPRSLNPKLSFNYPNLSELDVSDNDLGGSVAMLDSLVTQLAGHTQLHSLKLNNCGLGLVNGSFCKVAALLHKLPALTHLELRGINFSGSSDKHFATLLAYLQTNPTLVHLDLRECKLTPQQTSQLVAVLLERNRNLTTCLVDETVANTTARQQLKAVLERNQNKVQLESEYQAIVRNHQEFSQTVQDLKLDQEIRQLLDFARQAEQHYRDYHATLLGFAAHNYPSPSMVDNLYADHRQNGIWLIRLLANIINKEPNLRLLASHYAQVERLRREFIPDSQPDVQTALCELNSNYAARLLSAQNAQDFRQAVMFLNETPRELLSPEVISLLQKSCAVYAASCTASISAAPNLTYAIEAYYQLLSLVNSAAILLCDEKVELNLRRNTYSQLAQLIIQHCRAEGCTLATCSQLFQLLHGVTRYNRNTPEINQALALLTKNYVLHLLRSLQQSSGRLFGLTQKDVAALMAQVQALTTPDIARVLEITKAFCTKWQGEARKYAALREMAAIVTAVERYMPNDKECRGDTDSVSCSSPAATKAVAASSFAPPMPGAFAASAPPISKMSDEPDDDKAPPSKGTTAEKGEPGKQSKQSTDQLPFPLQAAAPLQLGFFAQQGQGGAQFTAPSAPPLLQSAEVSERNPIRELLDQCAREEIDLSDAPKKLIDPISLEIMTEPVKIQSGRTYEKSKIVEYLKTYDTDLIDRTKITDKKIIIPDWDKQSDIMEYLETKIRQHKQASKPSKQ